MPLIDYVKDLSESWRKAKVKIEEQKEAVTIIAEEKEEG
jgi:hypothetical protein